MIDIAATIVKRHPGHLCGAGDPDSTGGPGDPGRQGKTTQEFNQGEITCQHRIDVQFVKDAGRFRTIFMRSQILLLHAKLAKHVVGQE